MSVGAMLLTSILLVWASQATGIGQSNGVVIEAEEHYALVFSDSTTGGIAVHDAETGAPVYAFEGAEIGFVRVALRALIFDRNTAQVGADAPFHLITTTNGRSFLTDPETGEFVALNAFGGGNGERFDALIHAARTSGTPLATGEIVFKGDAE